uniref:Uncharacterized protein n=1 Tax=Alexandrium monilatum TaxID=311494 RepID=A0A7S4WIH2_9DINO
MGSKQFADRPFPPRRRRTLPMGFSSAAAPWACTIRNTFIEVPIPDEECGSPVRKVKSDPTPQRGAVRGYLSLLTQVAEGGGACDGQLADRGEACETASCADGDGLLADRSTTDGTISRLSSLRSVTRRDSSPESIEEPGSAAPSPRLSREQSGLSSASDSTAGSAGRAEAALDRLPVAALAFAHVPMVLPMVFLLPVANAARLLTGQPEPLAVVWSVDEGLLDTDRPKVESPAFLVDVPGLGRRPFRIVLYAAAPGKGERRGLGFQRSRGHGRVEVRSLAQLPSGTGRFSMSAVVGAGDRARSPRPPAPHDFSARACCAWRRVAFREAVDPASRKVAVRVDFAPLPGARP